MPEYNDITIDEIIELAEMAEQAANDERATFGCWDATEPLSAKRAFDETDAVVRGSNASAWESTDTGAKRLVLVEW